MVDYRRLEIIHQKAKRDKATEEEKAAAENMIVKELTDKVKALASRIGDILQLANACRESGVDIPISNSFFDGSDSGARWGYPHEFIAEGIHHNTGLITDNGYRESSKFTYLGIERYSKGYTFYTDGEQAFMLDKVHTGQAAVPPKSTDLVQFLEEFPVFEQAFLGFIDSLEYA